MEKETRNYRIKDVDMLVVSAAIVESALKNETFLAEKRSTWAPPYFKNLSIEIDSIFNNYLGVDSAKNMRAQTKLLLEVMLFVEPLLSEIKVQIIEDFKYEPKLQKEILTTLGFEAYHKGVQNDDQESMVNLLYAFRTNIGTHRALMMQKGISDKTIKGIVESAEKLKNANVAQEGSKGQRKEITAEGVKVFNGMYDRVISICKIASNFYKNNPALRDQFSFSKVSKALNMKPVKKVV
ncbi:hypothetical protein ACI6PS_05825 [Flavobacterium sp. PLA-1-15]|uniref:hypothetical protein n=1 Tax=Flavobacterium sp. PLA-1-15 TaxID=3380533 RepID=UPI003B7837E1